MARTKQTARKTRSPSRSSRSPSRSSRSPSRSPSRSTRRSRSPRKTSPSRRSRRSRRTKHIFPDATVHNAIKYVLANVAGTPVTKQTKDATLAVSAAIDNYVLERAQGSKSVMEKMAPKMKTLMEAPVAVAFTFCGEDLRPIFYEDGGYLQNTVLKRAIKSTGIPRVSKNALLLFNEYMNAFIEKLVTTAAIYAEHARRITLKKKDVEQALTQIGFKVYM